ncbi:gamma-aminobutyric acid receptor alpha-like [Limulus polyphemus]|uniref:Gamma-aminobutyric acid receptor alpha-like n=1 Tax=Limulus polyphemus TaxID=6850 RepID=A0ABM1TR94_LIMPO|nr:gamma-aminobutyric acid receptor alpha-like [Limulus polyphemus]
MNLENFPMDMQRCPLRIGSFAYSTVDVVYLWNPARRVVIHPDMKMSQFDLIDKPSGNQTDHFRHSPFSVLLASFHLQRHMGYFVIEVYAPCIMLVVLSWVSFWINREATADRVALGVTTVLTMTFLGLESRNDLPRVSYCTALDYYVALCFFFVFATIAEFAVVHYYTKVGSGECFVQRYPVLESNEDDGEELNENEGTECCSPLTKISEYQKSLLTEASIVTSLIVQLVQASVLDVHWCIYVWSRGKAINREE